MSDSTQLQQQQLHSSCFHLSNKHQEEMSINCFNNKALSFLSDSHLVLFNMKM